MPVAIGTLPTVTLDYSKGGPGLLVGLKQLEAMLNTSRQGYLNINVVLKGEVLDVVMARSDLYVLGFRCGATWFHFDDADWPFAEPGTKLGYAGQYSKLGGLTGNLTAGAIEGIGQLANISKRPQWKEPLRTLLVVVAECARLIPVQMQVLGLLNNVLATVALESLAHYIQNWDKASKGADMSCQVAPNLRQGFQDPTILKR